MKNQHKTHDLMKIIQIIVDKYEGCRVVGIDENGNVIVDCPLKTQVICATELRTILGDCISQGGNVKGY